MHKKSLLLAFGIWACSLPAWGQSPPFADYLIHAVQDGSLDRNEYRKLQQLAQELAGQESSEAWLAQQTHAFLKRFPGFIQLNYTFTHPDTDERLTLEFYFAPTYSESDPLPTGPPTTVLAQISQNDILPETLGDSQRCGAAALLNSYYLLHGSFTGALQLLNLPTTPRPTYRDIHWAQETLYNYANSNGQPGLTSAFRYTHYANGTIATVEPDGEILVAASRLHLKLEPLVGQTVKTIYQRRSAINRFWRLNPQGVLIAGVYLDIQKGTMSPARGAREQNHFVTVFRHQGRFYALNSGVLDNGNGKALIPLSNTQMEQFVYTAESTVDGVTAR